MECDLTKLQSDCTSITIFQQQEAKMQTISMKSIFDDCQNNVQCHQKLLRSLYKMFIKMDTGDFFEEFVACFKFCLTVNVQAPVVDRTMDFVAEFVNNLEKFMLTSKTEHDEKDCLKEDIHSSQFQEKFWDFILGVHVASSQYVRLHACQLISKILHGMNEDAEIDADLFSSLQAVLLKRIHDKCASVRVQAVSALSRLQDASDALCPVVEVFLHSLGHDPNPDVRSSILENLVVSKMTLLPILQRTRDVKDSVRKAAYTILANQVHIKSFKISQRIDLLRHGLHDRSAMVQKACRNVLLCKWLTTFDGKMIELLKCLDVEEAADVAKDAVWELLTQRTVESLAATCNFLDENRIVKPDAVNSETVFYWRILCEFLKDQGNSGALQLETILPDIPPFCAFLQRFIDVPVEDDAIEVLKRHFTCEQLIHIIELYDLVDEKERQCVQQFVEHLLTSSNIQTLLLPSLPNILKNVMPDVKERLVYLTGLISKLREVVSTTEIGMTNDECHQNNLKIAKLKVEINVKRDILETHIAKQEFTLAQEVKDCLSLLESRLQELMIANEPCIIEEIIEDKNDEVTLEKCLMVLCEIILEKDSSVVWSSVMSLIESLVIPAVQNESTSVRNLAVKALGLACITKETLAGTHLLLFLQVCQLDTEVVRATAVQAVFDILLLHGFEIFIGSNPDSNKVEQNELNAIEFFPSDEQSDVRDVTSDILVILLSLIDCEFPKVHAIIAEGFGKLLYSRRIVSPKVLSRLLILWYNPVSKDNVELLNFLGVFFPAYASSNRLNQEVFRDAFIPTINILVDAPSTSPLCQVNVNNVIRFMVELMKSFSKNNKTSTKQDFSVHNGLAVKICNAILATSDDFKMTTLVKTLKLLKLSKGDKITLKDLDVLCQEIRKNVKDRLCMTGIMRFHKQVTALLETTVEENDNDASEKSEYPIIVPETPISQLHSNRKTPNPHFQYDSSNCE